MGPGSWAVLSDEEEEAASGLVNEAGGVLGACKELVTLLDALPCLGSWFFVAVPLLVS